MEKEEQPIKYFNKNKSAAEFRRAIGLAPHNEYHEDDVRYLDIKQITRDACRCYPLYRDITAEKQGPLYREIATKAKVDMKFVYWLVYQHYRGTKGSMLRQTQNNRSDGGQAVVYPRVSSPRSPTYDDRGSPMYYSPDREVKEEIIDDGDMMPDYSYLEQKPRAMSTPTPTPISSSPPALGTTEPARDQRHAYWSTVMHAHDQNKKE